MLKQSKYIRAFAILLIIIGSFMLVYKGVKLIKPDKVTNIGPIEIKTEQTVPIDWSPYTGFFFIGLGGSLLILISKKIPPPELE